MKKRYRIFLASSYHLKEERDEFEKKIARFNDELIEKNTYLEVVKWEKLDAAVHHTRKQDYYNEKLKTCDLLVLAYWGELGIFTNEEYQLALQLFKERSRPRIYICKKTSPINFTPNAKNVENLKILEAELAKEGEQQWVFNFDNVDSFINKIKDDIYKLFEDVENRDFIYGSDAPYLNYYEKPAKLLSINGVNDPTVFIGRQEELRTIKERLNKSGRLMLINAEGGIGKTTLAARYWDETLHNYQYNAWLFCENGIINALKELTEELELNLAGMTEAQQLQELKHALKKVHDEFLLVLDNANDDDELSLFRKEFAGFHWHVIITSRCQGIFPIEQELSITHLPPPLAKSLFTKYYNESENKDFDTLLDRLLKAINYHTLLVEVFAKNLSELAEVGFNLSKFLEKLETEGLHLKKHSFEVKTEYPQAQRHKVATTDEILDILYDFGQLTNPQRYLLINLSILPAEQYELRFINQLLGENNEEIDLNLRSVLKQLVKKGWISEIEKKYRMSPVIQKLVLEKHQEVLKDESKNLISKLLYILDSNPYNLLKTSLKDAFPFIKLVENIDKSFKLIPDVDIAHLNYNASIYAKNIGDFMAQISYCLNFQSIYKELLIQHPENNNYKHGLAVSYSKLGDICIIQGDLDNAYSNYVKENRLIKEISLLNNESLSFKHGLSISYERLGNIYLRKEDFENALIHYKEKNRISNEVFKASNEDPFFKQQLAISYSKLGDTYVQLKNWEKALLNIREYNRLLEELNNVQVENMSFKYSLANSYCDLGIIYEQIEDSQNALINYKEYNRISESLHIISEKNIDYMDSLGDSQYRLGYFYKCQNNFQVALDYLIESHNVFFELYEVTHGKVFAYTYKYVGSAKNLSEVIKTLIEKNYYSSELLKTINEDCKAIRRRAYLTMKPLFEQNLLQNRKKALFEELSDESWYDF